MPGPRPKRTNQVKGVLLEEVVLLLLEGAGYRVVDTPNGNEVTSCAAGLQVRGRGGEHQIDAIADYLVAQPFTFPQRLLVEAKCYSVTREVDLAIVRNALAVYRDVSEYWFSPPGMGAQMRRRFHYHYAVFATSAFTDPAQRFAFAHDINLLPLGRSTFFRPVITAIEAAARRLDEGSSFPLSLKEIRRRIRLRLRHRIDAMESEALAAALAPLIRACESLRAAYLAMAGGAFSIFLVPAPGLDVGELAPGHTVRLFVDPDGTWALRDARSDRPLFSFDLPQVLFELYAQGGALSRDATLLLKQEIFSDLQFVFVRDGRPRLVSLRLDGDWISRCKPAPVSTGERAS